MSIDLNTESRLVGFFEIIADSLKQISNTQHNISEILNQKEHNYPDVDGQAVNRLIDENTKLKQVNNRLAVYVNTFGNVIHNIKTELAIYAIDCDSNAKSEDEIKHNAEIFAKVIEIIDQYTNGSINNDTNNT